MLRPDRLSLLRRAIVVALVLGVAAFLVRGAARPDDPSFDARRPLEGFGTVSATVRLPDGRTFDWCALLADSEASRARGLMAQTDLRGYDAMVFRFPSLTTGRFYMYRTVLPLSIAFLDDAGAFVSGTDMAPCPEAEPARCETYGAAAPYRHAVEVTTGGLGALGLGSGATVTFGGSC